MEFMAKVQKLVARQIRRAEKMKAMKEAFKKYDVNGNGSLDREEFKDAWRSVYQKNDILHNGMKVLRKFTLGQESNEDSEFEHHLDVVFDKMDTDGSGAVGWEEFKNTAEVLNRKIL